MKNNWGFARSSAVASSSRRASSWPCWGVGAHRAPPMFRTGARPMRLTRFHVLTTGVITSIVAAWTRHCSWLEAKSMFPNTMIANACW